MQHSPLSVGTTPSPPVTHPPAPPPTPIPHSHSHPLPRAPIAATDPDESTHTSRSRSRSRSKEGARSKDQKRRSFTATHFAAAHGLGNRTTAVVHCPSTHPLSASRSSSVRPSVLIHPTVQIQNRIRNTEGIRRWRWRLRQRRCKRLNRKCRFQKKRLDA